MEITAQHVQNVLRTHSRQLQRAQLARQGLGEKRVAAPDPVLISEEACWRFSLKFRTQLAEKVYEGVGRPWK